MSDVTFVPNITPITATWLNDANDKLKSFVSVFDYMTEAQIADVQAGVFNAGVITAIDAAIAASTHVNFPDGNYKIKRAIKCSRARQILRGNGRDVTYITADTGFVSETVGGSTASALIWYQAPGLATDGTWVDGGSISDFTLNCSGGGIEGVRINRVTTGQEFKNLRILDATVGIYGTKYGWITKFDNIYVQQATTAAIRLTNGYNGCTFTNCFLWGGGIHTPVLLDISMDCYGNSFTGGAIEDGIIGVRVNNSQIAFNGTDFEACTQKFMDIFGLFAVPPYGGGVLFANPPVSVTGCTFVGVPSVAGIMVTGGTADISGCFAINNDAAPGAGIYFLNGISGGDVTVAGFEFPCISESGNTARGWANQFATGTVFSRMTRLATQGVTFPTTAVASTNANTLDDYKEGTFVPTDGSGAGLTFTTASGDYTKIGNVVLGNLVVTFPVTADATQVKLGGLPYVSGGTGTFGSNRGGVNTAWTDSSLTIGPLLVLGTQQLVLFNNTGASVTNAQMSGKTIWLSLAYRV